MYSRWWPIGLFGPNSHSRSLWKKTFSRPKYPGPFRLVIDSTNPAPKRTRAQTVGTASETDDPSVTFTAADIAQQKATHEEALRLYLECQTVEQALRVQLIEAVDSIYLDALCNSDTDMIHESLSKIHGSFNEKLWSGHAQRYAW